jgi:hypothetical protein
MLGLRPPFVIGGVFRPSVGGTTLGRSVDMLVSGRAVRGVAVTEIPRSRSVASFQRAGFREPLFFDFVL